MLSVSVVSAFWEPQGEFQKASAVLIIHRSAGHGFYVALLMYLNGLFPLLLLRLSLRMLHVKKKPFSLSIRFSTLVCKIETTLLLEMLESGFYPLVHS